MRARGLLPACISILGGRTPCLSIEITRECPLRCPGCYAYDDAHLGREITLRQLSDYKGDALVRRVLSLVDHYRPLHVSLVGGDPLVRYRELGALLPELHRRGILVMLVTSAFRPIPASWGRLPNLTISVSVDGLQPEHDERRRPATYDRILKNIAEVQVVIHCTITGQMMNRSGYLEEFLQFWSARDGVKRIWMSMFTPQRGVESPECLSFEKRDRAIAELLYLCRKFPKLDMGERTIREFAKPPKSPEKCIFARTTHVLSADLRTRISPCQFGGDPDCSRCGCFASMVLAAVGHYSIIPGITVGRVLGASALVGKAVSSLRRTPRLEH
jgi:MoaA/NifB/PqqE/SkfB family radical SAM enzyme